MPKLTLRSEKIKNTQKVRAYRERKKLGTVRSYVRRAPPPPPPAPLYKSPYNLRSHRRQDNGDASSLEQPAAGEEDTPSSNDNQVIEFSGSDADGTINSRNTFNESRSSVSGSYDFDDVPSPRSSISHQSIPISIISDSTQSSSSSLSSNSVEQFRAINSNPNDKSKWYEIMSNQQYSDVKLISSDNLEISTYRCILAKYSQIFEKVIIESTELPVKINVENFNAETIKSALGFLYDKTDSINGKEMDVFKFADRYDIKEIMDVCCSFFEEYVDSTNVCEYIEIAYLKNFEELKQKCLKILVEKKKEIDPSKLAELPKNIIIDAFCL